MLRYLIIIIIINIIFISFKVYACQNQSVIPNFCSSQDNVERSIITMRTRANGNF